MTKWKDIRAKFEELGYTVTLKGKKKNEYICEKGDGIVNLVKWDDINLEVWVFDNIHEEITYNENIRMSGLDRCIEMINGEINYINGEDDIYGENEG